MSLPITTLPLPAISFHLHQPFGDSRGESRSLPGIRNNSLDLGLRSAYPSPPMSRRSSSKPNASSQAQQSTLPPIDSVRAPSGLPSLSDPFAGSRPHRNRRVSDGLYRNQPPPVSASAAHRPGEPVSASAHSRDVSGATDIGRSTTYVAANVPAFQIYQFQSPSTRSHPGSAPGSGQSDRRTRTAKQHVQSACINCKKAHLSCDEFRPCERCVVRNLESSCVDVKHKKRGRPRLRDYPDLTPGSNTEDAQTLPPESKSIKPSPSTASRPDEERSNGGQSTVLSPLRIDASPGSLLDGAHPIAYSQVPIAYLDMDFQIAQANAPFQRAFGFAGSFPGTTLEELVDQSFVDAIRHLRIVLLEERDALNPSYLPPIRTAEAPHAGQIPAIDPQNLETICRDYAPRREMWTFKSRTGGSQSLPVQLRLARTEVIFLTLIVLAEERSGQLGSGNLQEAGSSTVAAQRANLAAMEARLSNPPLRRSSRLESHPNPPYTRVDHPGHGLSVGIPQDTFTTSSSPFSATMLSPMHPNSAFPAIGNHQPHSPLYEMLQSQRSQRRRSVAGGPVNSSTVQGRRRQPPPSISFYAVPTNDPAAYYAQAYATDPQSHYNPHYRQSGSNASQHPQPSPTRPRGGLRLPPLANFGHPRSDVPPSAAGTSSAQAAISEPPAASTLPAVSNGRREESEIQQTRERGRAREERQREHDADVKQEEHRRTDVGSSPNQPSSSRKRRADEL